MTSRKKIAGAAAQGPTLDTASAVRTLQELKQRGLGLADNPNSDRGARDGWYNTTRAVLAAAFGSGSSNIRAVMWAGAGQRIYPPGTPPEVIDRDSRENLGAAARMLDSCIEQLELLAPAVSQHAPNAEAADIGNSVFIVHGTDEGKKEAVARFLTILELDPIILHEQANKGQTLIEKFEEHADVSFAVVILTADDVDGRKGEPAQSRARQNVVFELGYFVGRLGRKRVCTLYEADVEIPSDYKGIVYTPFDGAWRTLLARELKAAGFPIDMNRAL